MLGNDVQSINVLTVIASESYDSFAKGLQTELADAVAGRPVAVTADLFKGKVIVDARGNEQVVDGDTAQAIFEDLISNGYGIILVLRNGVFFLCQREYQTNDTRRNSRSWS